MAIIGIAIAKESAQGIAGKNPLRGLAIIWMIDS
jgi:hypothetical protein